MMDEAARRAARKARILGTKHERIKYVTGELPAIDAHTHSRTRAEHGAESEHSERMADDGHAGHGTAGILNGLDGAPHVDTASAAAAGPATGPRVHAQTHTPAMSTPGSRLFSPPFDDDEVLAEAVQEVLESEAALAAQSQLRSRASTAAAQSHTDTHTRAGVRVGTTALDSASAAGVAAAAPPPLVAAAPRPAAAAAAALRPSRLRGISDALMKFAFPVVLGLVAAFVFSRVCMTQLSAADTYGVSGAAAEADSIDLRDALLSRTSDDAHASPRTVDAMVRAWDRFSLVECTSTHSSMACNACAVLNGRVPVMFIMLILFRVTVSDALGLLGKRSSQSQPGRASTPLSSLFGGGGADAGEAPTSIIAMFMRHAAAFMQVFRIARAVASDAIICIFVFTVATQLLGTFEQ